MPLLLLLVSFIFPAFAEDVFDAAESYVDLGTPFYASYEKSRTTIGVALVAEVSLEVANGEARTEVMTHRPLLRDRFQRVLALQTRKTFVSADGWQMLAQQALESFNAALSEEGCTDCVLAVLFPAGIVPEG